MAPQLSNNRRAITHNVGVPGGEPGTGNAIINWVRLPFQAVLILWAWWYTQPDEDPIGQPA